MHNVLEGRTILITRPRTQAGETVEAVKKHGARPLLFPVISVVDPDSWESCDNALRRLADFDAVAFTSVNGVSAFVNRASVLGIDLGEISQKAVYAVGESTAGRLREAGIPTAALPPAYSGVELGNLLAERGVKGKRFLLPQGSIARQELNNHLIAAGAFVEPIMVYRTVEVKPPGTDALVSLLENGVVDVVTFASPSAVRGFFHATHTEHLFKENGLPLIAVIGATTSEEVKSRGLPVSVVAGASTMDGLIESIRHYFQEGQH